MKKKRKRLAPEPKPKREVSSHGKFRVLVDEGGAYSFERDETDTFRKDLLDLALCVLRAYDVAVPTCPTCRSRLLVHHFSGEAELPEGYFCSNCKNALYDDEGNEICKMT